MAKTLKEEAIEQGCIFKDILASLEGVIGHEMPTSSFQTKKQAEWIGMTETEWSKKKNSTASIKTSALAKLVVLYKLDEFGLDYRVFEKNSVDEFLQALKGANVGTYGASIDKKFRQLLLKSSRKREAQKITIIGEGKPTRRGGVSFGNSMTQCDNRYQIGTDVRLLCEGPLRKNLIVLNERLGNEIHILRPSLLSPVTKVTERSVVIPDADQHLTEYFKILGPEGVYRLFAVWTTSEIAACFAGQVDLYSESPAVLSPQKIMDIYKLMDAHCSDYVVASNEFEVFNVQ